MNLRELFEKFNIDVKLNEHMASYEIKLPEGYEYYRHSIITLGHSEYDWFIADPVEPRYVRSEAFFDRRNLRFQERYVNFDGKWTVYIEGVTETGWVR